MKAKNKKLELRKLASAIKVSSFAYAGLLAGLMSPMAHAGPEGGVVTGGSGTIDVDGSTTTVDQTTDLLSIDWDSFNLTEEELIQFLQPDSSSIVLNRILDQDVTTIQGSIEANGHVILVNPRGVLFTETATVNVGAITASGLDMSPEDFMNGDFAFQGESGSSGVVINRGVINASSAVLVGKQVTNASSGLISAELVSLAAADEALLTFDADGMIGIKVTKEVMENDLGLDSAVLNEGAIEGAQVLMEASVSGDLFTAAVNNEGTVTASGIDTSGGKIRLFGSGSGVVNSGTLEASGSAGGEVVLEGDFAEHSGAISVAADSGSGGYVAVLGDEVVVSGDIDARGTSSGGEVLIGGDYQGDNADIRNAETTSVTAEANIDASGVGDADGGTVIVWADDTTEFGGTILAESGADGGDGGLVETSGKIYLNLDEDNMFVSTQSHGEGQTGLWLLDPGWMDIIDDTCESANCVSVTSIVQGLDSNDITIRLSSATAGSGPDGSVEPEDSESSDFSDGIRVLADIDLDSANTLTLDSFSNVLIESGYSITNDSSGELSILAGEDFTNAGSITLGGTLDVSANGSFTNSGAISVDNLTLKVGLGGVDTTNTLGDFTVTSTATVTAGAGTDTFIFSDNDDEITVTEDNTFTLSDSDNPDATITFDEIEVVNLGGGSDKVTGAAGVDWTLISTIDADTGTEVAVDNQAQNSNITFSDVETLVARTSEDGGTEAKLRGTDAQENFTLNDGDIVTVNGMTVSGMTQVYGSVTGTAFNDNLDASTYTNGLILRNKPGKIKASDSLLFEGIATVTAAKLTGRNNEDTFTIIEENTLDHTQSSIRFSGVSTVAADPEGYSATDTVVVIDTVTLTETANSAKTSGITFTGIEGINNNGGSTFNLNGSTEADTFTVVSETEVTANGISVTGFNSTIDTGDGTDTVTGADTADWTLISAIDDATGTETAVAAQAKNSNITFSNAEDLVADSANLQGTDAEEAFELTIDGDVSVNGMTFSGLSQVFGKASDSDSDSSDSLNASAYSEGLTLTGTEEQVKLTSDTDTLIFSDIVSATVGKLTGTDSADTFEVTGANALDHDESGISFNSVSEVLGNGGTDSVDASAYSAGLALTGVANQVKVTSGTDTDKLIFSGIASATTAKLTGSSADESFIVTTDDTDTVTVAVNTIEFTGVSEVDAGNGTDEVTGAETADWTLVSTIDAGTGTETAVAAQAKNSGITFSNAEDLVAKSANLQGTDAEEAFELTIDDDANVNVSVNGMTVSGLSQVVGNGGDDSLDASDYNEGLTLTSDTHQVKLTASADADTLIFTDIASAVVGKLTGTESTDTFIVTGANAFDHTESGISFSSVSEVVGNGGTDSVDATTYSYSEGLALTGGTNEVKVSVAVDTGLDALTFSGIASASTAKLTGSDDSDEFEITGDFTLKAAGISFEDVTEVDGGDGDDSIIAINTMTLTGVSKEAISNSITFSDIEAARGGELEASSLDDTFEVTGFEELKANQISFSEIDSVDAKGGTDSVTGADGVDWTLTGNDYEATNNGITFSDVEILTAVNADLAGTSGADAFVLQYDDDNNLNVAVSSMAVYGMSSVKGNDGNDTLDARVYSEGLTLTGTEEQVKLTPEAGADTDTLTFSNITTAITEKLTGTDSAEEFVVTTDDTDTVTVTVNSVGFTGVSEVVAGDGTDEVTGADTADWTLVSNGDTGTEAAVDNQAQNSGIIFSGVEKLIAKSANLQGTGAQEAFELTIDGDVTVNGMTLSDISQVLGNGGDDSLNASAYREGLTLTGTAEQVKLTSDTDTLIFSDIVSATVGTLTGTESTDTFVVTGANAFDHTESGISFSSVSEVVGNGGTDSVDATTYSYSEGLALTGGTNEVKVSVAVDTGLDALTFSEITSATTAKLTGSDGSDEFEIIGDYTLKAAGISFDGVTAVDGGDGDDSITAISTVALTGASKEAVSNSITFSSIEAASGGSLEASSLDDTFEVTGFEELKANQISFSEIDSVDAKDGTDSVTGADGEEWTLTGYDYEATNHGITFSNVETLTAVNADLAGTSGADAFVLQYDDDDNLNVAVSSMAVYGMSSVKGNDGNDTLDASVYSDGLTLTGSTEQVKLTSDTDTLIFSDIVSATVGTLTGTESTDTFIVTGANAFDHTESGISFSSVSEVVGNGGTDSVDATTYSEGLALTGGTNEVKVSVAVDTGLDALTFSNIASASTAKLTGSDDSDEFEITGDSTLKAAGISFAGVTAVDGGDGDDSIIAINTVTLTGVSKEAVSNSITFSDIEAARGGSLEASSLDDTFEVTGFEELKANQISFSEIDSVDAKGGTDSVTGADGVDWTLTGNDYEATNNGITFSDVEILTAVNADLAGTSGADAFVLQYDDDNNLNVAVSSMAVYGMSSVKGNDGNDTLDARVYSEGLTLTGTEEQVKLTPEAGADTDTLTFSNITTAITEKLTGTDSAEEFVVTTDDTDTVTVTVNSVGFTGVSEVVAGDGTDEVTGADTADWTLVSNGDTGTEAAVDNQAQNSGIIFSGVEKLIAKSANLQGTGAQEAFELTIDGDVTVNGMTLSDISQVLGNGGDDSLNASAYREGLTLTGTAEQVKLTSDTDTLIFSDIVSATVGTLTGTESTDTFVVTGANAFDHTESGISFSSVSEVVGNGGTDSVDATTYSYSEGLALTGGTNEVKVSVAVDTGLDALTFSEITSATTAKLTGSDGSDEFEIIGDYTLKAAGISFDGVTAVDGGDGDDSITAISTVALTGASKEAVSNSITFSSIEAASGGSLEASSLDDTFEVTGFEELKANQISFSEIDSVDAKDGTDSVTGADGEEWTLTGYDYEATNHGITFSNVETLTAVNADLAGTSGADAFVLQYDDDDNLNVAVSSMAVYGMSSVKGNDGNDTLDASVYSDGLTLTGSTEQVKLTSDTDTLIFSDIVSATVGTLTGTESTDTFIVTGANAFDHTESGISFSSVSEVVGNGGTDSVDATTYSEGLALTGGTNEVKVSVAVDTGLDALTFSNIASASTAKLTGSDDSDEFEITGDSTLKAAGISFAGVTAVDGGDGDDSIIAINTVTLTGVSKEAISNSITFSDIEAARGGSLEASSLDDTFEVTGFEELKANQISFSEIDSVDAKGGTDSVTGADGVDWTLTGNDYEATNNGITFSDVEILTAVNADLAGTSGADAFVLQYDDDNNLNVAVSSMAVYGMSSVKGNDGNDTLDARVYSEGLTLTGTEEQVKLTPEAGADTDTLTFSNITTAITEKLTGTDSAEEFVVTTDDTDTVTVTVNSVGFTGVSEVVAGDGTDEVTGADTADWTLVSNGDTGTETAVDNQAQNSGITFSGVEKLIAKSANLQGTGAQEAFELTIDGDVTVNGMTLSDISQVLGNGGDDSLNASAYREGLTLTGTAEQVKLTSDTDTDTLIFSDIVSATVGTLTGTESTDTFVVTGANAFDHTESGISFSSVSEVVGNGGTDSVDATTYSYSEGLALTGGTNEVKVSVAVDTGLDALTFSNIASASTAKLTGSDDSDEFEITGDSTLKAAGISFEDVTEVDGGDGDDSIIAINTVTLTGVSKEAISNSITFSDIEAARGGSLEASSLDDTFEVTGFEELKANQISFSEIDSVDAKGGTDSVTGADGVDWTLTGNDYEATNNGITFSDVEILTAVNADLAGTSGADAFVLQYDDDNNLNVAVSSMAVYGMSSVKGNDGNDTLDARVYSEGLTLTGTEEQVKLTPEAGADTDTLTFSDITTAITEKLTGTDSAEEFVVTTDDTDTVTVAVNSVDFTGVGEVDAGTGSDKVIGANGADWILSSDTDADNKAENSGIAFSNVETLDADNANLQGSSAKAETFVVSNEGAVSVNDMSVSGTLLAVLGNGNSSSSEGDSLNASAYSEGLTLTGTAGQVKLTPEADTDTLTFSDITSATTAKLTGSDDSDEFEITGDYTLDAAYISFAGVTAVDGGAGDDSISAISTVTLTGVSKEAISNSITFSSIEAASGGNLEASSGNDVFEVMGFEELNANLISFSGINSVDAKGGTDTVTGANEEDWTLGSDAKVATNSGITFSNVEALVVDEANLQGSSADAETFVVSNEGAVSVNEMSVSGTLLAVFGNGNSSSSEGDSLDASVYGEGLTLTGTAEQVKLTPEPDADADTLTFSDITTAITEKLTGTDLDEEFTVAGNNTVAVNEIDFTGVEEVDAGAGSNKVIGANGADWILSSDTDVDNKAENSDITFSNVESLVADNANLQGSSANAETFVVTEEGAVSVNDMTISGTLLAVMGNGSSSSEGDSLDASAYGEGLTLTNTTKQVKLTSDTDTLTFSDITTAITEKLTGTDLDEEFTVAGANAVAVNEINFTEVEEVNAGEGSDRVTGAENADWILSDDTDVNNKAENSDIAFSGVDFLVADQASLQGSSTKAEAFALTVEDAVTVNGMTVSDMLGVAGNGGGDSLDATAYSGGLTLTGEANEVKVSANADALTFSDIDSAETLNLTGTDDSDEFEITGNNALKVEGISFSKVTSVDGGTGDDSISAISTVTLTGVSKEAISNSITFSSIEAASGGNLEASSGNDVFEVTGFEELKANQISFSEIDSVDAKGGTDTVTGANEEDWTLGSGTKVATNSGITFSNVEALVVDEANLQGSSADAETFVVSDEGAVSVNEMSVSGTLLAVFGNGNSSSSEGDSLDASAYDEGLTLTGTAEQVKLTPEAGGDTDTLTFSDISSAITAKLTATGSNEEFTVAGNNAVAVNEIAFTGVEEVETGDGSDSVTGAYAADWTLEGENNKAINSGITFIDVELVTADSASLLGSSGADAFVLQATGDIIEVDNMTFSGVSAVDGQGGNDSLDASDYTGALELSGTANQVMADSLTFDGIVSAVTSTLRGSTGADTFTISGDNAATSYGIDFTGLSTINARGGNDTVIGADDADWALTGANKEAVNSSITVSNVENITAVNADLVATANDDAFVLQADGDVEISSITVSGMSAVDGNGGDDTLDASAYTDGLSLTGTDNQVAAGSLSFDSISSATTSILTNTHNSAEFQLEGDGALATAGISFSGLEAVNTSGSNDSLVATDDDDNFTLNSDGDISVAGIDFTGLESVDGAGGSNTVQADGAATWTSTSSAGALVDGSVEAEVNSLTVYFENLESVAGAGSYVGQDIDGEYEFSALDTMTIGEVTFADLDTVAAGSGSDAVYGSNLNTTWNINDSGHTVSDGETSLTITGIESITAGSGNDQFNLNGGELTEINTGAGNDTVTFSGTVIDSISLGAGDDLLTVNTDIGQGVELDGGSGSDDFQYNPSGATWEIYSSGNQVGNFDFTGFEYLDNTSNSITVLTDQVFDFENGGNTSESFNKNGAGLQFSGMRLGYDGEGDIYVTSSATGTIGGSLVADRAELVVAGDVDIEADVGVLGVATSGADINISVLAAGDLVIDEINAGRGSVSLASSSFGDLTAESYGDTHITASAVTLGTETQLWTLIGETTNPLRMDVTDTLDIYSISYYEPDFIGQIPTVTSTGDELQSIAGAQASQGLKSAVQNAVEDFSQVDPAIFSAVKPYSSGIDAVNSPEMRLKSGELAPSVASADSEDEDRRQFDAQLEVGVDVVGDVLGDLSGGSAGR
ncbi:filamentous hemagglutinin N-terminal domain-containing protein [Microbulbifer sp. SSSA002]|uniref:filamentous hemagglutinin N-terminal domain-containing protein n=1 Tax=Microbulbifer sp. SSSA002 TaxID=3243376 RepID=UPI004039825E